MKKNNAKLISQLIFMIIWTFLSGGIATTALMTAGTIGMTALLFPVIGIIMIIVTIIKLVKVNTNALGNNSSINDKQNSDYNYTKYTIHEDPIQTTTYSENDASYNHVSISGNGKPGTPQIIFSIIWLIILSVITITIIQVLIFSRAPTFILFIFIPFLTIFYGVGMFLLISGIKANKKALQQKELNANSNEKQNTANLDKTEDEYYVKYCLSCGEALRKSDSFCPSCGKSTKNN